MTRLNFHILPDCLAKSSWKSALPDVLIALLDKENSQVIGTIEVHQQLFQLFR